MEEKAYERISQALKNQKDSLDLSCLQLELVPNRLKELTWLRRLNLSSNLLQSLPEWIADLKELEVLDLRNNRIISLPQRIGELTKLQTLNLRNNVLTDIPPVIKLLPDIKNVVLGHNQIQIVPSWFFQIAEVNIENNPIVDPPIEVYGKGSEALANYFKERVGGTEKLFEAKLLIVGEPGAGKTTLMNKILNENYEIKDEISTKGIDIKPYFFTTPEKERFRINIWDFGGQEIYHATHQFFLTKRSLYLLLSDNRAEDTDFNYWLQTTELLSDNSPLIIVQNEKQNRKTDINEAGMRERFRNIKRSLSFNLVKNSQALRGLIREICHQVIDLPHIGTELPSIWVEIRKLLEEKSMQVPYIREDDYLEICASQGMSSKERAYHLSDYLHDLGVFLHFKDHPVLKRWIILRADWGTEAVYKVLDNERVIQQNGYFTKADLQFIWHEAKYADMHDELISLMIRFELCYQVENSDTFIAAQLLQRVKPAYVWNGNDNITVRYDYEFMPKGIITRFIVRMNFYIGNQRNVWREGVVLQRENTQAEIIETYGKREIRIRVEGEHKKEFLAVILDAFDKIHLTYANLKVSKLIPCNCEVCKSRSGPFYFEFNHLRRCLSKGISKDLCRESLEYIPIQPLIDDVFGQNNPRQQRRLRVFVSYHETDTLQKEQIKIHLKGLENRWQLRLVDKSDILAGDNERAFVREQLDGAEVIICLVSQDYISDEITHQELLKGFDRSEVGSCLLIPIIVRDCNWEDVDASSIKPITFHGQALFSDKEKRDEALANAAIQVREAISIYTDERESQMFNRNFSS